MCRLSQMARSKILTPRAGGEKFTGRIVYDGPLMAPVAANVEVGHLQILRGATEVLDLPLKTAAAVEVGSLPRRAMDAGLEYAGDLFRKYVANKYIAKQ